MNRQKAPNGIEWTRVYGRPGYTWNAVGGCFHDCKWTMPDGTIAGCYAKSVAERLAQAAYPSGFEHHYWNPKRLSEPQRLPEPSGIFLDSMADLMGRWVPDEHVEQVLDVCRDTPQHIYFLLTKNAPRLLRFSFPLNLWVGVSMPPDSFMGRPLTRDQQARMLRRALDVLRQVPAPVVRWMSFEPLSWDVAPLVKAAGVPLEWAVIGAASSGPRYYLPDPDHVRALLGVLDGQGVPVFFKGNLRGSPAAEPWRDEFPKGPNQ
jgi:protein gp37